MSSVSSFFFSGISVTQSAELDPTMEVVPSCEAGSPYNGSLELRVAAIFVILVTSLMGTLFPIVSRRVKKLGVPERVYQFAKYFGSGVIIATAFIHLLAPGIEALGNECLPEIWRDYPWALGMSMMSVFLIFFIELVAHRSGVAYIKRKGLKTHDVHSQNGNLIGHTAHGAHISPAPSTPEVHDKRDEITPEKEESEVGTMPASSSDYHDDVAMDETVMAQLISVAILEFGVVVHSFLIGLTLAVNDDFVTLFVVLVFHQTFEGLGLGARLSMLPLPSRFNYIPYVAGTFYACITPLGIAIGLGVRNTYNPDSINAAIVAGTLDSVSSGILLYTGLVELLAHDFIFNRKMIDASNGELAYSLGCVVLGAGIMALLGRWA